MAAAAQRPEILVIVGPTAGGKSDLALKIAKNYNGEIIAADSRTLYKGMDIGTAKASSVEQAKVRHWGLDLVDPGDDFNTFKYKNYAQDKINDIKKRRKMPILVGGTGLFIDSVIFDFEFRSAAKPAKRHQLEELSIDELQKIIRGKSYKMPENSQNKRHLVRVIEAEGKNSTKNEHISEEVFLIGLLPPDETLKKRIAGRVRKIFDQGIVAETQKLVQTYGDKAVLRTAGIAYATILRLLNGEISQEEAVSLISTKEWQYARRQKTWFKRNKHIIWFTSGREAYDFVTSHLA